MLIWETCYNFSNEELAAQVIKRFQKMPQYKKELPETRENLPPNMSKVKMEQKIELQTFFNESL